MNTYERNNVADGEFYGRRNIGLNSQGGLKDLNASLGT